MRHDAFRSEGREALDDVSVLVARARGEFLEMPGLRLAAEQAARLWAVDRNTSERILAWLVHSGFLWRTRDGFYVRPSVG